MESNVEQKTATPGVKTDKGPMAKMPGSPLADSPWQEWVQGAWQALGRASDVTGQFFADNKQPLITLGIILLGIVSVKILVAILAAINDIPLLAPMLQLVGLSYSAWFVWRYLWKASNRQELLSEFEALKNQIFGS